MEQQETSSSSSHSVEPTSGPPPAYDEALSYPVAPAQYPAPKRKTTFRVHMPKFGFGSKKLTAEPPAAQQDNDMTTEPTENLPPTAQQSPAYTNQIAYVPEAPLPQEPIQQEQQQQEVVFSIATRYFMTV